MNAAPRILPNQIFTIASLTSCLGLKAGTVPREIRLRRLRCSKRAGRVFILGSWVLEWLRDGERRPRTTALADSENGANGNGRPR
jgi:hypothetical protein